MCDSSTPAGQVCISFTDARTGTQSDFLVDPGTSVGSFLSENAPGYTPGSATVRLNGATVTNPYETFVTAEKNRLTIVQSKVAGA